MLSFFSPNSIYSYDLPPVYRRRGFHRKCQEIPVLARNTPEKRAGTCVYHGSGEGGNWHKLPWPISQRPGLEIVPAKEVSLKNCSPEHFLFDFATRNCFSEQHDDRNREKEGALVLEKRSRGVPRADRPGADGLSPRPGVVRK